MNKIKVGFIGLGNMGSALAKAVARGGFDVIFYDQSIEKCNAVKSALEAEGLSAEVLSVSELISRSDYIFLGVKPQGLDTIADEIAPILRENPGKIIVSMLAGVKIAKLKEKLSAKIIRIMPNTPVGIGEGVVIWSAEGDISDSDGETFEKMCEKCGVVDRLPEEQLDAVTAISGCGPAFVYMFIDALSKGGEQAGIPREKALLYGAQTLIGASKNLMASKQTPEELKRAVCSPNGSTLKGVGSLEADGFEDIVIRAVLASYKRTVELGQENK